MPIEETVTVCVANGAIYYTCICFVISGLRIAFFQGFNQYTSSAHNWNVPNDVHLYVLDDYCYVEAPKTVTIQTQL